jgi:hypothetical protein
MKKANNLVKLSLYYKFNKKLSDVKDGSHEESINLLTLNLCSPWTALCLIFRNQNRSELSFSCVLDYGLCLFITRRPELMIYINFVLQKEED